MPPMHKPVKTWTNVRLLTITVSKLMSVKIAHVPIPIYSLLTSLMSAAAQLVSPKPLWSMETFHFIAKMTTSVFNKVQMTVTVSMEYVQIMMVDTVVHAPLDIKLSMVPL
jgi:hypothetical protein